MEFSFFAIQILRYISVGLASNLILYILYIALTAVGVGHKTAMTLLYLAGVLQTFFFNKHWTFSHRGDVSKSMLHYFATYGIGYVLNLMLLYTLVDILGWPHTLVQGLAFLVVAPLLFLVQKYWVFRYDDNRT